MSDFEEFPKMARLSRGCVITEKLDGTNAQVYILDLQGLIHESPAPLATFTVNDITYGMWAGSRNRWITLAGDNYGFAAWVHANAEALMGLGPGRHFGEWWGAGIQRKYGLTNTDKRFSLFNVGRWIPDPLPLPERAEKDERGHAARPPACCSVVPILYRGPFTTEAVEAQIERLRREGSVAVPGFMKPEGVVVWHEAARVGFKKTLEKDEQHKGQQE